MKKAFIFIGIVVLVMLVVAAAFVVYNCIKNAFIPGGNCSGAYSCVVDDNDKNYKLCYYDDIDDNGNQIQTTIRCANND